MAKITAELTGLEILEKLKLDKSATVRFVQTHAGRLAAITRTNAPRKSGDLRRGIIPSPWQEKTAVPGKVVHEVYFDDGMNDTFVKYSKSGKRYYYPASQEYGFRIANKTVQPGVSARASSVKGKYFMRDSTVEYAPAYVAAAEEFIAEVAKVD